MTREGWRYASAYVFMGPVTSTLLRFARLSGYLVVGLGGIYGLTRCCVCWPALSLLQAPSSEGDGLEQQQAPQYQQKLRGGDTGMQEETGDAMEEVESETEETCNASSGEAGDGEQEQQQPATGEGPTDRWGDDLQLEDVALDGDEKEEDGIEEPEAQEEAGTAEEQQENTTAAGAADGSNNAGQDSVEGENMDVDVTEPQQQCVRDEEQQMHQDEASDEAGDAPDNSSAAADTQEEEESALPPEEGGEMETQEAREEKKTEAEDSDRDANQDPSVQGRGTLPTLLLLFLQPVLLLLLSEMLLLVLLRVFHYQSC